MKKILVLLFSLTLSSCANSMGSPKPVVKEKTKPKATVKYTEADAKKLIEKHCKVSNMQKMPRLKLVDLYLCGEDLSLQVNRDLKEEQVKLLVNESEESQRIIIKDKAQKAELRKLIAKTYALSNDAKFSPPEEIELEKKDKKTKPKSVKKVSKKKV